MDNAQDIFSAMAPIKEVHIQSAPQSADFNTAFNLLCETAHPFIMRGTFEDWPMVQAAKKSPQASRDYLLSHHVDREFGVMTGQPENNGRIFYNDDMSLNVKSGQAKLPMIFDQMSRYENASPQPTIYMGSLNIEQYFTGMDKENAINLGDKNPLQSIWIGSKTRIAAHNDFPDNLAVVAAGRRRFTLFPPAQFENLYLGPVDKTPAGRPISMVDFLNPDFDMHPKFRIAIENAQTIELQAGDAIFIPSNWWHHIEGLDGFNILVNYWWQKSPKYLGQPDEALFHAMMAIRDLPAKDRAHFKNIFNHYVFDYDEKNHQHIPHVDYSILSKLTPETANRIRSYLLRTLNK